VSSLATSTFLASAAGTLGLQNHVLGRCSGSINSDDPDIDIVTQQWLDNSNTTQPTDVKQRSLDQPLVNVEFSTLTGRQTEAYHRAWWVAAVAERSGDWLHALPITSCGLRLDNEAMRVAVGLRLGCSLCQPHQCPCGAMVETRGSHALSCRFSAGRQARHHYVNDIAYRALVRAGVPATKEPKDLLRADGKGPDGLTLVPWNEGHFITWDVTVADTVAESYLANIFVAAAEAAAERKTARILLCYINMFSLQLPSKPSVQSVTRARAFYVALAGASLL
jgi:hypothetical protein